MGLHDRRDNLPAGSSEPHQCRKRTYGHLSAFGRHFFRKLRSRLSIENMEGVELLSISPAEKLFWHRCESLEYQVFLESGYVEESPTGRIADFDRYASMEFLAAFTGDRQLPLGQRILSGVVRLVYAPHARKMGPGLFPTIDHAEELEIPPANLKRVLAMDPRRCFDIATMAIAKAKRDGRASKALITAIMMKVFKHPRLRYGFAAIDTPFYHKLKQRRPFEDLGPSTMYMGSMSTATMVDSFRVHGLQKLLIPTLRFRGYWQRYIPGGHDE